LKQDSEFYGTEDVNSMTGDVTIHAECFRGEAEENPDLQDTTQIKKVVNSETVEEDDYIDIAVELDTRPGSTDTFTCIWSFSHINSLVNDQYSGFGQGVSQEGSMSSEIVDTYQISENDLGDKARDLETHSTDWDGVLGQSVDVGDDIGVFEFFEQSESEEHPVTGDGPDSFENIAGS